MRRTKLRLCRWSGRIHSRLFPISVASLPMSTNNRTMQHVTHPSRDTYKTACLPNCMSYYRQNSWITISGTVGADNRCRHDTLPGRHREAIMTRLRFARLMVDATHTSQHRTAIWWQRSHRTIRTYSPQRADAESRLLSGLDVLLPTSRSDMQLWFLRLPGLRIGLDNRPDIRAGFDWMRLMMIDS